MYVVLDTETTGHNPGGDLIQLAVLNPFGRHFNMRCAPLKPILPAATAVHGITNAEAELFPGREEVRTAFRNYVQNDLPSGVVVIGHNIQFDADVLQDNLSVTPQRTLDTLRMARKLIDIDDIGGHRLDAVFVYLYPERLKELLQMRNAHDAFDDCKLTYEVYIGLVKLAIQRGELTSDDIDAVCNWAAAPMLVTKWGFGKHKGMPLDHDWGYVQWYMRQKDVDPDIAYSINLLNDKRKQTRGFQPK